MSDGHETYFYVIFINITTLFCTTMDVINKYITLRGEALLDSR